MLDIFAFLLLGAATFAAFNLISRTIEAQRREIGIGMALGVPPRALARRPLLLGAQVALVGVVLGMPFGLAADAWLGGVMQSFFPLPVIHANFQSDLPPGRRARARAATAGDRGARVARGSGVSHRGDPRRRARRAGQRAGLASQGSPDPGRELANLPLRNILRTPRRTLMSLLGIGAVVTIVSRSRASWTPSTNAVHQPRRGARGRAKPADRRPRRARARRLGSVRRVAGAGTVGASQASLRLPSTLIAGAAASSYHSRRSRASRCGIRRFKPARCPSAGRGCPSPGRGGLAPRHHRRPALRDAHPVPNGPRSFSLVRTTLPVTGIDTSPLRFVAYANAQAAARLHVGGLVNRVSVVPGTGRDADASSASFCACRASPPCRRRGDHRRGRRAHGAVPRHPPDHGGDRGRDGAADRVQRERHQHRRARPRARDDVRLWRHRRPRRPRRRRRGAARRRARDARADRRRPRAAHVDRQHNMPETMPESAC